MLGDKQWGFKSLHSTIHALQKAVNNWLLNIDKGKTNAVIFLDLRKAFDTVDHNIFLKKLSCYGLQGKELFLMHSYLSDRSQCCSIEEMVSDFIPITCGVPQGSILGPLLFIIYVNDLHDVTRSCDLSMYADDTHITSALKKSSDLELNTEILPEFIKICDWLQANKLSLNVVKTEYMIIGTEQSIIQLGWIPKIKVVNTYLKKVNKTKSLGLIIDDNLKWDDHIQYICSKVRRNIGLIEHIKHCISKRSSILLYKSLVEPYFRYGNTVWGLCNSILIDKLQTLQNRTARIVTDTSYDEADHPVLLRELGWLSNQKLITLDLGIFMYKVNKGITPDPICELFQKASDTHRYETRYAMEDDFHKIAIKKEITKTAISHSGPKLWNNIPRSVREAPP